MYKEKSRTWNHQLNHTLSLGRHDQAREKLSCCIYLIYVLTMKFVVVFNPSSNIFTYPDVVPSWAAERIVGYHKAEDEAPCNSDRGQGGYKEDSQWLHDTACYVCNYDSVANKDSVAKGEEALCIKSLGLMNMAFNARLPSTRSQIV